MERKIATPLALFVLLFLLGGLSFVLQKAKTSVSVSASKIDARLVEFTNITASSAVVFWQTSESKIGWVQYGQNQNPSKTVFDDRDIEQQKQSYINHYVTLKDLQENTTYYVTLFTQDAIISNNGRTQFQFTTTPKFTDHGAIAPAFGKILSPNGANLKNGFVLLSINGTYPLSTMIKDDGEWLIPLFNVINKDTYTLFPMDTSTIVTLEFFDESANKTIVKTTIGRIRPLPQTIVFGNSYDFTADEPKNVLSAQTENLPSILPTRAPPKTVDIIYPVENAQIPGTSALFKGTALAGEAVKIKITDLDKKNTPLTYTVYADSQGIWKLYPGNSFSAGRYTIAVTSKVENNKSSTVTRTFSLLKSGEAVLGEATLSGTLTPQPPTPQPTLVIPTTLPTVFLSPTPLISPTQTLPQSGTDFLKVAFGGSALILVGLGLVLVF